MKTSLTILGTLLLLGLGSSQARAQYPYPVRPGPIYCPAPPLRAPDATGPGFYTVDYCGNVYGPTYCLYPPFQPFQGMLPIPACPNNGPAAFRSHPYVRSPRDFFMVD